MSGNPQTGKVIGTLSVRTFSGHTWVGRIAMSSGNQYTSIAPTEKHCEGETFASDGYPEKCGNDRVFQLTHSTGRTLHLCEYHIECYWNFWPTFRAAIRDIWPVRLQAKS
jgi:hypothetical protein